MCAWSATWVTSVRAIAPRPTTRGYQSKLRDVRGSPLVYTPGDNEWADCHRAPERRQGRSPGTVVRRAFHFLPHLRRTDFGSEQVVRDGAIGLQGERVLLPAGGLSVSTLPTLWARKSSVALDVGLGFTKATISPKFPRHPPGWPPPLRQIRGVFSSAKQRPNQPRLRLDDAGGHVCTGSPRTPDTAMRSKALCELSRAKARASSVPSSCSTATPTVT